MQVQKLTYMAHGYSLALNNGQALVEDQFEAWSFGPVIRKLYDSLKIYGSGSIERLIRYGDDEPLAEKKPFPEAVAKVTPREQEIIEDVWLTYGRLTAYQLSVLTHEEGSPWKKFFSPGLNKPIPNDEIRNYFITLT